MDTLRIIPTIPFVTNDRAPVKGEPIDFPYEEALDYVRCGFATFDDTPADEPIEIPEGVVPGETPGWPVDASTGEPVVLTDEQRDLVASFTIEQAEQNREATVDDLTRKQLQTLNETLELGLPGNAKNATYVDALKALDPDVLAAAIADLPEA